MEEFFGYGALLSYLQDRPRLLSALANARHRAKPEAEIQKLRTALVENARQINLCLASDPYLSAYRESVRIELLAEMCSVLRRQPLQQRPVQNAS